MKLYFVRHGETVFNKQGRLMGARIDEPLDNDGLEQSHKLADELADVVFEKIYTSPLQRARTTAEIINEKLHLEIEPREELHERDFGTLSGKTWEQIELETGQDLHSLDDALRYDYSPYGGESVADVKARLSNFLAYIRATHPEEPLLVVTHFGIVELMYQITNHPLAGAPKNDSVHEFTIQ